MLGDLHVHTRYSDGSYSIREALGEARRRGLDYISFTDHDRLEQNAEAAALAPEFGIDYVSGIEISGKNPATGRKVHILGYYCRSDSGDLAALCDPLLEERDALTRESIGLLASKGWPLSLEEVMEATGSPSILYKQHVMVLLVAKGLASEVYGPEYHRIYDKGGVFGKDIAYVDPRRAVGAVRAAGGIPVLAHPGQYDSWDIVDDLVAEGLAGIEFYHESHAEADYERLVAIARRHPSLVRTGGSDDHGRFGSIHAMGEIRAPFGCIERLKDISRGPESRKEG
ncbi:MAG: PHP domain-containing protein [Treponema sp.]|nr:PHP domain-containing protein [Treponema sp.]